MKALRGGCRSAFLAFFVSHIPITILIDGQGAFGTTFLYPAPLRNLVIWYTNVFGDVLMKGPPIPWFSSVICCELLVQLPFFFVAVQMLLTYPTKKKTGANTSSPYPNSTDTTSAGAGDEDEYYPSWFQTLCLMYGAHVSTTLVPILATFASSPEMSPTQKAMTMAIYSPYLIFPMVLLVFAARNDVTQAVKYYTSSSTREKDD